MYCRLRKNRHLHSETILAKIYYSNVRDDDTSIVIQLLILKWQPTKSAYKQISLIHTGSNHALIIEFLSKA